MIQTQFDQPVTFRDETGVSLVHDAEQASALLRGDWPPTRGKWYHAANRACARAVLGLTPPHVARGVFERAVSESRLN